MWDILMIDEVSMLSGEMLETMDGKLKEIRGNDQPFGGVQIILSGDFFQLPPISKKWAPGEIPSQPSFPLSPSQPNPFMPHPNPHAPSQPNPFMPHPNPHAPSQPNIFMPHPNPHAPSQSNPFMPHPNPNSPLSSPLQAPPLTRSSTHASPSSALSGQRPPSTMFFSQKSSDRPTGSLSSSSTTSGMDERCRRLSRSSGTSVLDPWLSLTGSNPRPSTRGTLMWTLRTKGSSPSCQDFRFLSTPLTTRAWINPSDQTGVGLVWWGEATLAPQ